MRKFMPLPLVLIVVFSCSEKKTAEPLTAFINATVIDGTGADPVSATVVVNKAGKIQSVGTEVPENATVVDLKGKYIIPGLINSHGHVGEIKGIESGNYSRENVIDNLEIYARYGITTVVSLGGDKKEAVPIRDINDTTTIKQHARLYMAGDVGIVPAVIDSNHAMGVDWMKIRVDDNLGNSEKMPEEAYKAMIARSHELGYKIASHMYYLEDARKLLAAGVDMLAHSVRDKPVDDDFVALIKEKKICYCPTLTREMSTFVYEQTPDFFTDPFFRMEYDTTITAPLEEPARQEGVRNSKNAQIYKAQLPVAMANLKKLSDAGVPIAFGSDTGVLARFQGYFEHVELQMMAEAGLTPMQILVSATRDAAKCMGLKGVGTLEVGNNADFVVLNENPLTDIKNSRTIESVWIGGQQLSR